jgi:micrococcal nuclease
MSNQITPYVYQATVDAPKDIWDGDTMRLTLDLGFSHHYLRQRIRLARVDAPELKGSTLTAARRARNEVRKLIFQMEGRVIVQSVSWDRHYNRAVCEVWTRDSKGRAVTNISDHLIAKRYAKAVA